ncbi:glycosyltransferase family 2 protein [Neptunitalea lumnitzerae]|uniref:Glycosyltransferase n=1 Tax=Neptunitalea lumnitzerae TaxID=2965509 RepID=A0ABQ5MP06_9FLAO|nr:glycosyltransferase [Neptunitalea sp. Y10]GLB50840.1 hypothetical protein Y10_32080 [Neptunitalea sp. Y10]
MLTIVLTYRNRDLNIVRRCLDSLQGQTDQDFELILVDYGSDVKFAKDFKELANNISFANYIYVATNGQLWNKSRAINIALKKCKTPYFLMGDIDLLYHPEMISRCKSFMRQHDCVYFQYGFLSKEETDLDKNFEGYVPEFLGNGDVTGTTLYKTDILKGINGYDEFYHGWGAEDTDVHLRLKNAGYGIKFYEEELLVKHQWHPKSYRTKKSTAPFHTRQEKVNHDYMWQQLNNKKTVANLNYGWGELPSETQLQKLERPEKVINLTTLQNSFEAFVYGVLPELNSSIDINIKEDTTSKTLKNKIKKMLGKKHFSSFSIEEANNLLLSMIISTHRLSSYKYTIDWNKGVINLKIVPYETKN